MRKASKIWLGVAAALVVLGMVMFTVVMSTIKWDFMKLGTVKYETNEHSVNDSFNNISIESDTADIIFLPSENGLCKVICHEDSKARHHVTVSNDTLNINIVNEKNWYDYIGISFGKQNITVYLPEKVYALLAVETDTGDIMISKEYLNLLVSNWCL